jgi:hypothetical protein
MVFELEKVDKLVEHECTIYTYQCKEKKHKVRMTEEDAKLRGVSERLQKDDDGEYVFEATRVVISPSEISLKEPRVGKKSEIIKVRTMIIRCLDCGYSEEIAIENFNSRVVQLSR